MATSSSTKSGTKGGEKGKMCSDPSVNGNLKKTSVNSTACLSMNVDGYSLPMRLQAPSRPGNLPRLTASLVRSFSDGFSRFNPSWLHGESAGGGGGSGRTTVSGTPMLVESVLSGCRPDFPNPHHTDSVRSG